MKEIVNNDDKNVLRTTNLFMLVFDKRGKQHKYIIRNKLTFFMDSMNDYIFTACVNQ
jgi:glutathionyl-hydroquinone reductase